MSSRWRINLRTIGCFILSLCLVATYAAGFAAYWLWVGQDTPSEASSEAGAERPSDVFWEAWDAVEQDFYGELPTARQRTYAAIQESLLLLDDAYTIFVEPQTRELERDHMRGAFGGIGVDLWYAAQGQIALSPYPESPAAQAGIEAGDVLLAIDGEAVTSETTIDDVRAILHGEVDTPVTLTLSRDGESFDVTLQRREIQVPSLTWRMLDQTPDVGYIHIQGFTARTDEELIEALTGLKQDGATGLILDLRDNFGGLLDSAVSVASQFLDEGVVMYEVKKSTEESVRDVKSGGIATDIPLVVLVNGNTASAAEVVAGALQDHGRAQLVGERTYGKGSVQLIYELSDGSSLHVTSAIWLTPDRHPIDGMGLTPDVLVPQSAEIQDAQLEYAIEHLPR